METAEVDIDTEFIEEFEEFYSDTTSQYFYDFRQFLHAHPEISGTEYNTTRRLLSNVWNLSRAVTEEGDLAEKIAQLPAFNFTEPMPYQLPAELQAKLDEASKQAKGDDSDPVNFEIAPGIRVTMLPMGNGFWIDVIPDHPETSQLVGLRAEIDALGNNDDSSLPYSSQNPNASHACGHDLHAAIGVGVFAHLASVRNRLSNGVRILFQPSEETSTTPTRENTEPADSQLKIPGAVQAIRAGASKNVAHWVSVHVQTKDPNGKVEPEGTFGTGPGPINTACEFFTTVVAPANEDTPPQTLAAYTTAMTAGLVTDLPRALDRSMAVAQLVSKVMSPRAKRFTDVVKFLAPLGYLLDKVKKFSVSDDMITVLTKAKSVAGETKDDDFPDWVLPEGSAVVRGNARHFLPEWQGIKPRIMADAAIRVAGRYYRTTNCRQRNKAVTGNSEQLTVDIEGGGGHSSRAERTVNTTDIAAFMANTLPEVVADHILAKTLANKFKPNSSSAPNRTLIKAVHLLRRGAKLTRKARQYLYPQGLHTSNPDEGINAIPKKATVHFSLITPENITQDAMHDLVRKIITDLANSRSREHTPTVEISFAGSPKSEFPKEEKYHRPALVLKLKSQQAAEVVNNDSAFYEHFVQATKAVKEKCVRYPRSPGSDDFCFYDDSLYILVFISGDNDIHSDGFNADVARSTMESAIKTLSYTLMTAGKNPNLGLNKVKQEPVRDKFDAAWVAGNTTRGEAHLPNSLNRTVGMRSRIKSKVA